MNKDVKIAGTLMAESCCQFVSNAARHLSYQFSRYASEEELLSSIGQDELEVIVMELGSDSSRPLKLQQQLVNAFDPACVIFIGTEPDVHAIVKALRLGAVNILSTNSSMETMLETIEAAVNLHAARATWIRESRDARLRLSQLSPRQREIMQATLDGQSNKAIAFHMKISAKTVEKHRNEIRYRTGTSTLAELERLRASSERPLTAAYSLSLDNLMLLQQRTDMQLV